jgi:molybdopterin molybdotransferase
MGILAAVGRVQVAVHPGPRVAIVSTGDEIVEPGESPGPGKIRNSNAAMLVSQARRAGARPEYLGIARDNEQELGRLLSRGLDASVLVISGGVSAGARDLVPEQLGRLGVERLFHKVSVKPGKPAFFGTRGKTLVFGLPGNPVSAMVCFELFTRPAIRKLRGYGECLPRLITARLEKDWNYKTDRPTYFPARLTEGDSERLVAPVGWLGSADLRALTEANSFASVPPGDHHFEAGQRLSVLTVDE